VEGSLGAVATAQEEDQADGEGRSQGVVHAVIDARAARELGVPRSSEAAQGPLVTAGHGAHLCVLVGRRGQSRRWRRCCVATCPFGTLVSAVRMFAYN
jgi:hypothetical protein